MAGFLDAVQFLPASGGLGDFAVSTAVQGYMKPVDAGAVNGTVYRYRAESADQSQWEIGFGVYSTTTQARTTILFSSNSNAKVNFTSPPIVGYTLTAEDLTALIAATVDLGGVTDTTLSRAAAGQIAVEGDNLMRASADSASQADQESATLTTEFVSPARQHFHPSAPKSWGFTTGAGTPVLNAVSYNVTSITDSAVGDLTVTIGNDFSSANFTGIAVCTSTAVVTGQRTTTIFTKAAGSVHIGASDNSNAAGDPGVGYNWCFWGDL